MSSSSSKQLVLLKKAESEYEKGRKKYENEKSELLGKPVKITNAQYREALGVPNQLSLAQRFNAQSTALANQKNTAEGTHDAVKEIQSQVHEIAVAVSDLQQGQQTIINRQIDIHSDIDSYGKKTLRGIKDIKEQGSSIFNNCFPPRKKYLILFCFNKMLVLIFRLIHFMLTVYYNSSLLCISIGKSLLSKIPLFGLVLAPLFELIATIISIWLSITILTKSTYGIVDGKTILITLIQFLRYIIKYSANIINDNMKSLFIDIKDILDQSGLSEDGEKVQEYISSIPVVKYAEETVETIKASTETVDFVVRNVPDLGIASTASSIYSYLFSSTDSLYPTLKDAIEFELTGGNSESNVIDPNIMQELEISNMKQLFGTTGDLMEGIFKTIHNTVKLYNELSPEGRNVMNQYLRQNKQKTLDYQLNQDLRKEKLYLAINKKINISFNPKLRVKSKTIKNKSIRSRSQGSRKQGSRKQGSRKQGSRKQGSRKQGSRSQGSRKQGSRKQGSRSQGSRKRKSKSKSKST